jgi:hypothetical protein
VTHKGVPVDYGSIQFLPVDLQNGVSSGAIIGEGEYRISEEQGLPPGEYQVRISSPDQKPGAASDAAPGESKGLAKERLPPKYNAKTTLKIEILKGRGGQEVNFNLE